MESEWARGALAVLGAMLLICQIFYLGVKRYLRRHWSRIAARAPILSGSLRWRAGVGSVLAQLGAEGGEKLQAILNDRRFSQAIESLSPQAPRRIVTGEVGEEYYRALFFLESQSSLDQGGEEKIIQYCIYPSPRSQRLQADLERLGRRQREQLQFSYLSGRLWREICDNFGGGLLVTEAESQGRYLYANNLAILWLRLFDWKGKRPQDIFAPEFSKLIAQANSDLLAHPQRVRVDHLLSPNELLKIHLRTERYLVTNPEDQRSYILVSLTQERPWGTLSQELQTLFAHLELPLERLGFGFWVESEPQSVISQERLVDKKLGRMVELELSLEVGSEEQFFNIKSLCQSLSSEAAPYGLPLARDWREFPDRQGRQGYQLGRYLFRLQDEHWYALGLLGRKERSPWQELALNRLIIDLIKLFGRPQPLTELLANSLAQLTRFFPQSSGIYVSYLQGKGLKLGSNFYQRGERVQVQGELLAKLNRYLPAIESFCLKACHLAYKSEVLHFWERRAQRNSGFGSTEASIPFIVLTIPILGEQRALLGALLLVVPDRERPQFPISDLVIYGEVISLLAYSHYQVALKRPRQEGLAQERFSERLMETLPLPIWYWREDEAELRVGNEEARQLQERPLERLSFGIRASHLREVLHELCQEVLASGRDRHLVVRLGGEEYSLEAMAILYDYLPANSEYRPAASVLVVALNRTQQLLWQQKARSWRSLLYKILDLLPMRVEALEWRQGKSQKLFTTRPLASPVAYPPFPQPQRAAQSGRPLYQTFQGRTFRSQTFYLPQNADRALSFQFCADISPEHISTERVRLLGDGLSLAVSSEPRRLQRLLQMAKESLEADLATLIEVEVHEGRREYYFRWTVSEIFLTRSGRTILSGEEASWYKELVAGEEVWGENTQILEILQTPWGQSLPWVRVRGLQVRGQMRYLCLLGWAQTPSEVKVRDGRWFQLLCRLLGAVCELELLQEETAATAKAIEQSNLAQMTFLSSMSHEIRHPLNAILGYSELILGTSQEQLPDEERIEHLKAIGLAGNSMLQLFADVKSVSMLEQEGAVLVCEYRSLAEVLAGISDICSFSCRQKGLALKIDLPPALPYFKLCWQFINQVLLNLVGNAIKFTTEGEIVMRGRFTPTDSEQGLLTIAVQDTGCGLSEEDQSRLFTPFTQFNLADMMSLKGRGTGLGLSISWGLIQKIGGSLRVESKLEVGSTFTIELPQVPYLERKPEGKRERQVPRKRGL